MEAATLEAIRGSDHPIRRLPRLYGKVQAKYPGRWLSYEEAFGALIGTCDGSERGRRNELVLRLGLSGLRAAEIIGLTIGSVETHTNAIAFIGKGRRPRRIVMGDTLAALVGWYLATYEAQMGERLAHHAPLVCRLRRGPGARPVAWGHGIADTSTVREIVQTHATAAGLGHLSPHDLRRSAAGILHNATDAGGGHLFDLLDIQKVLDHADPAVTMRSYLNPLDTFVKVRAGALLD